MLCIHRIRLLLGALLLATAAAGQSRVTLSGRVTDVQSGETLIGATVRVRELPAIGAVSNEYGFYSLTLPPGTYTVQFSLLGFETQTRPLSLTGNTRLDVALSGAATQLGEVSVRVEAPNQNITRPDMGVEHLQMKDINRIPVLLGERDPLKVIQLLPGIKSAGEGNSGFHVRGGNSDQNLIVLDEAPVYNASHLLGFFSTFNADAIRDFTIYKGGMPAQYGGRLSSVVDVRMNEGNNRTFHAGGGIGLISSRLYAEGPLVKDKSSFLVTGRRTYADAFLKLSNDPNLNQNTLYFYDLNAKLNYTVSPKDRLFLSGYFGRDNFGLGDLFNIDWGNATGTLRWNHLFSEKLFSNTALIYSQYDYKVAVQNGSNDFSLQSSIRDYHVKQEFSFYPTPEHSLRFGLNVIHHTLTPRNRTVNRAESSVNPTQEKSRYSLESAVFVTDKWQVSSRFSVEYGLRLTSFAVLGGSDYYTLDADRNLKDTLRYAAGTVVQHYLSPEPRLSAAYVFNEQLSLKASYTRNVQNLHLISNSGTSTPNDRWLQSSNLIRPEIADQVSVGLFRNFGDNQYEFSAETYYKALQNQLDYRNGADFQFTEALETQLLSGKGRAYGLELLLRKKTGRLTGWVGYTLSRTEKQIDGINGGNWYAARQDRTHDLSVVGLYPLSKKWTLSATWVYNTGNAVSFPTGKYRIDQAVVFHYTERNGYRMPAYHRLDLGATVTFRKTKRLESDLSLGLYNAYGRANPYAINFEEDAFDPGKTEIQRITLFKFVPSITYNFKF